MRILLARSRPVCADERAVGRWRGPASLRQTVLGRAALANGAMQQAGDFPARELTCSQHK
eukprot:5086625-Prymnesium_polylepis.1